MVADNQQPPQEKTVLSMAEKRAAQHCIMSLRENLLLVARSIRRNRTADLDPEIIIELRGEMELLLERIHRADG